MTDSASSTDRPDDANSGRQHRGHYLVIARRYRPQTFEELVGQEHVGRVLAKAIETERVGHAYLFTGARGVGKTSAARIFAKCLNCVHGPTPKPCNECDICRSISVGEDIDVLEIDGASNRGIDEIRELRQNVGVRPSRARFKVYIIDEVHMLTREAFNALLKTLEEPPPHTKFIFCTTEPHKIPITILSRCQRFDFNGMQTRTIVERLEQIAETEGVRAEPAALETLARRAGGSMRDGQSLLEQMLAFCDETITEADVQKVLGTASDERVGRLVKQLAEHNAGAAIAQLDGALAEGADLGQLLDQLIGYLRDTVVSVVGCGSESLLYTSAAQQAELAAAGQQFGLESLLAVVQILEQAKSRMRTSTHGRTLAELALVRSANLGDVDEISQLVAELRGESPLAAASRAAPSSAPPSSTTSGGKKNDEGLAPHRGEQSAPVARSSQITPLTPDTAPAVWKQVLSQLSDMMAQNAALCDRLAIRAPNRLVVGFRAKYNSSKAFCERPERLAKIEEILAEVTGQQIRLEFDLLEDEPAPDEAPPARAVSPRQRLFEAAQHPLVRRAGELFEARVVHVDDPRPTTSTPSE